MTGSVDEGDPASGGTPGERVSASPPPDDTLGIVALALGLAALGLSIIPFYGMMFALPLGVVAVVLGVIGRRRRAAGRGMALGGATAGGVALLVTVGWVVVTFIPFWGFSSESTVSVTATESERVDVVEPQATPDPDPARLDAEPDDPSPPPGALTDATGRVELALDGEELILRLDECVLGGLRGGAYLRGRGDGGRIHLRTSGTAGGGLDVLLAVQPEGQPARVFVGEQHRTSGSERSTVLDRRRLTLTGGLRGVLDEEDVRVDLSVVCR